MEGQWLLQLLLLLLFFLLFFLLFQLFFLHLLYLLFLPFIFFPPQLLLLHLFLLLFLFSSSSQCGGLVNTTLLSLCYWCNDCRGGGASGAEEVVEPHLLASRSASLEGRLRCSSGNRWSVSSCDIYDHKRGTIETIEQLKLQLTD